MMQKIVILGRHFICNKRICNIVQKTITIDESEVENYLHLHKFHKDQCAIVVDESINVFSGLIYTGEAFVNPITMESIPINCDIDEEEVNTEEQEMPNVSEIEKFISELLNPVCEKLDECISKLDEHASSPGPNYIKFDKVRRYKVVCGSVHIRKGPSAIFPSDDFIRRDVIVSVYGVDTTTNFGFLGNGKWVTLNDNFLQEVK